MPNGMSLSPAVQAYGQQQQQQDPDQLFKERFNQMAYSVLYSKFADLAPSVVTFKILDTKVEDGQGIGVFVLMHEQKTVYVPVILTDGKLKPIEIFFYKDMNTFLPFTSQWLDEVSKMSLDDMGGGANIPKEVPQDVNIRDLVLPPTTTSGRVGLASADDVITYDAKRMFKEAEDHSLETSPQFLNIMRTAPKPLLDGVKLAFERRPSLLKKFAANYGIDALTEAMSAGYARAKEQVKTAAAPDGAIRVLGKGASSDQFTEVFGDRAGAAFSQMLKVGVAVNDSRPGITKVAVRTEGPTFLDSPGTEPGWYKLFFADGQPGNYLVIPFPKDNRGYGEVAGPYEKTKNPIPYLIIGTNGKEIWKCHDVMGQKLHNLPADVKNSKIHKILNQEKGGDTPTAKSYGIFVNVTARGIEATEPFEVDKVVTDGGIKRIYLDYGCTYVIDNDPSRKCMDYTMGGKLVFVPNTAKFVQIMQVQANGKGYKQIQDYNRERKTSVIKDPHVLLRWVNRILSKTGATQVNVKSAGLNQWWVNGDNRSMPLAAALEKVAQDYGVSAGDAIGILRDAQEHGRSYSFILDRETGGMVKAAFEKTAQPMQEQPMSYEGSAQGAPMMGGPGTPQGMSPQQGQEMPMGAGAPPIDPMTGQPIQPPQQSEMSPTDLAIGEAIQGLQQQNELAQQENQAQMQQLQQKMEMEMQQNDSLVQVLQGIQDRSQAISGATGGMVPAGAEQSPAVAAQMLAPTPPEEPPPPPMPMMDEQQMNLSPESIMEQINPELAEQAGDLQDRGTFDTAAIGMLASAPILQDIVSAYVPNLEKAVDNLGRVLLTLWMKEKETKESIGDEAFISLEEKLRAVFKNLGDVVLELSHNAMNGSDEAENAQMTMNNA
jgi:hypothetical protein